LADELSGFRPKLRSVEAVPIIRNGRPSILLRDPLQLSQNSVAIPQELALMLTLCDGTRNRDMLRAALAVRSGLLLSHENLDSILSQLDEALLLESERFELALADALQAYREAPCRPPSLAGESYPAHPQEMRELMGNFIAALPDAASTGEAGLRGLVSPHIDYLRGGPVYAAVWSGAREALSRADLVVLLGTDHCGLEGRLALTRQDYSTPFGILPTEKDIVDVLAEAIGPETAFAGELHHRIEHSIELAAVWLHFILDERTCPVVPILCGSLRELIQGGGTPADDPLLNRFVEALSAILEGRRALVVAAADLAHVGPAFGDDRPLDIIELAQFQAADDHLIEHICAGDAAGFWNMIQREGDRRRVCGLAPIYITLRLLGEAEGVRMAYERCVADERETSFVSICGVTLT
jgi:AmmeMemoRadiSam system protein B